MRRRLPCIFVAGVMFSSLPYCVWGQEPPPEHVGRATEFLWKGNWGIGFYGPENVTPTYGNYPDDVSSDDPDREPDFLDPRVPKWNKKSYDKLMKQRDRVVPIAEELDALRRLEKVVQQKKGELPEEPLSLKLSEEHLFRSMIDGERQSIREFLLYERGSIRRIQLYCVIRDATYYVATIQDTIYNLPGYKELKRRFADRDRDGLSDIQEVCARPYDFGGVGEAFGSDCQLTDVSNRDTDGDGWWDGTEKVLWSDPRDAQHTPDFDKVDRLYSTTEEQPKIIFAEDP